LHDAAAPKTDAIAVPVLPSAVAEIVAMPAATPVATPLELTVATLGFDDAHDAARPVSTASFASNIATVNGWLVPIVIDTAGGVTVR
jgi:hypothetical protein